MKFPSEQDNRDERFARTGGLGESSRAPVGHARCGPWSSRHRGRRAWRRAASATPGASIVGGPIVARGPLTHETVIGVPQTTTVTRTVQVRVGKKTLRKRVSFQVETVQRLMSCGAASPCDMAFQQLTIAPGGHTGWHTHPGPTLVSVAQGEGTLYHGVSGCPAHKYATGTSFFQPTTEVHNYRETARSHSLSMPSTTCRLGHRTPEFESTSRSLRAAQQSRRKVRRTGFPRAAGASGSRPWPVDSSRTTLQSTLGSSR